MLSKQFYQPRMVGDVSRYINNYFACKRAYKLRNKTLGLLKLLPILDYLQKEVLMDFQSFPPNKKGFNNILIVVDRLGKRAISLLYQKEVTTKDTIQLYFTYIQRIYGTPKTITCDRGPQFISAFLGKLYKLVGAKLRITTTRYT